MINKIMNVTENDPMYKKISSELKDISDDNLVIVAKSYKNRKDDAIKPIAVKNGIYFYIAYELNGGTAYFNGATPEQIYKAKANMMHRVRIGTVIDMIDSKGQTLSEFKPSDKELMNVATLDCSMYGGGLLYCREFLKEMENKIGKYYIIPSSIHELIFVSVDVATKDDLTHMVKEVNSTEITDNNYLADRAFEAEEWM